MSRTALIALSALALTASAALAAESGTPRRGGTLIFALGADPSTLNRNVAAAHPDGLIGCAMYQGLMRVGGDGSMKPLLAKSFTVSPDGLTYDFQIQQTTWQDGKPLTSADIAYTLTEISAKYSSTFTGAGRAIDHIDTPAPDRVIFHLKQPYGPFLLSLTCANGAAVLPKHIFEGTNPLQNKATLSEPVASGPFLLAEWKRGDYLRLKRNPNYWEPGKPYLDELVAKIIPQPAARIQALQAGEIDYITYYYVPVNEYPAIKANPKLALEEAHTPPGVDVMMINVGRKPLDDKRLRQVLLMATDLDYLQRTAFHGVGGIGTMSFTNRFPWAQDPSIDFRRMYPFDAARANALLDEAGLKRGADGTRFKLSLLFSTDIQDYEVAATAIKSMWRNVGIDVTIEGVDRAIATKRMYNDRDYDVALESFTSFWDPALGMAPLFTTAGIGRLYGNATGYSNPTIDGLFAKGEASASQAERGKSYAEIQRVLSTDLPILTIHENVRYNANLKTIHGLDDENLLHTWREAWRED